jgi:hypothetical protein
MGLDRLSYPRADFSQRARSTQVAARGSAGRAITVIRLHITGAGRRALVG